VRSMRLREMARYTVEAGDLAAGPPVGRLEGAGLVQLRDPDVTSFVLESWPDLEGGEALLQAARDSGGAVVPCEFDVAVLSHVTQVDILLIDAIHTVPPPWKMETVTLEKMLQEHRELGASLFKEGRKLEALRVYERVLEVCRLNSAFAPFFPRPTNKNSHTVDRQSGELRHAPQAKPGADAGAWLAGDYDEAGLSFLALCSNMAACCLALSDALGAQRHCVSALRVDPDHTKARYRLAQALVALGDNAGAEEHLEKLDGTDTAVAQLLRKAQAGKLKDACTEKKAFARMFQ